jgi:UDP-N-acetylmuramate--alanine ligase
MIGWIFHALGKAADVMNGAVMKNFVTADTPFASALVGAATVRERGRRERRLDRLYEPRVAVLNNVTLDHKEMDELRRLFRDFVSAAETAVLNLDDPETALIAEHVQPGKRVTFGFRPECRSAGQRGRGTAAQHRLRRHRTPDRRDGAGGAGGARPT